MKRLICLLTALGCACAVADVDYSYILLDDGTAMITGGILNGSHELIVPETLDGYPVTVIGAGAFAFQSDLTKIVLPDSVREIMGAAFLFSGNLTQVTLPAGLKNLGGAAFLSCTSLAEITLPDTLTEIVDNPFDTCTSLKKIGVSPEHPTLATLDGVLFDKNDMKLICCPAGKTATQYEVPQGIQEINSCAFGGCGSLIQVRLPSTVKTVGVNPFIDCGSLETIRLPIFHAALATLNGELIDRQEDRLICYPAGKKDTVYQVPQGIRAIGDSAFYNCRTLMSVTLPESVTSIGPNSFYGCENLTSLDLPASVEDIDPSAFYECTNLTITVVRDSYGAQFCKENGLSYVYTDSLDWLNH